MIRWFQEKKESVIHKIRAKRKEGASLISVVIGTMFILAIGITVLTVATRYVASVFIDRNSTDYFYEAEGVLTEVRTGLIEQAATSAKSAYTTALESYTTSSGNLRDEFGKNYLLGIANYLSNSTLDKTIFDSTNLGTQHVCGTNSIDKLKGFCTDSKGDVSSNYTDPSELIFYINYDTTTGYTLTLKGVHTEFVDDKTNTGYKSTVDSDIVFSVPDYQFEGNSLLEEIKNYIIINDKSLNAAITTATGAAITGNVYTGQYTNQADVDADRESGILIGKEAKVTFNSPKIITRGSFEVESGANVTVTGSGSGLGEFWVQNICLRKNTDPDSTLSTNLYINDNSYVSNDLDIRDSNSVVTLGGKYYGYSYNKENIYSSTEGTDSTFSSAILINGINTTLNASTLSKLVLAGRAFVDRKNADDTSNAADIRTGESISVRSNQIAYLVPDQYIVGEHNPLATDEYTSASVNKTFLLQTDQLGNYLDTTTPVIENYSSEGYVFLFLNFKSEEKANEYFKDYYTGDMTAGKAAAAQGLEDETTTNHLASRMETYLMASDLSSNTKFSGNLYLIAGNVVYNYNATNASDGIQTANYYDGSAPNANLLSDGRTMAQKYIGNCKALSPAGYSTISTIRLDGSEEALVAGSIINYGNLTAGKVKNLTITSGSSITSSKVTVVNGDHIISSSDNGLLIVNGDVTVNADFRGLILANGKVTIKQGCNLTADMLLVGDILNQIEGAADADLAYIKSLFRLMNGDITENSSILEKCIYYQNWKKNEG